MASMIAIHFAIKYMCIRKPMGVVVVSFVLDSSKILFLAKDAHLSCAFIKRKQTVHTNIRIYVGPMQKKNHSSVQARCNGVLYQHYQHYTSASGFQ